MTNPIAGGSVTLLVRLDVLVCFADDQENCSSGSPLVAQYGSPERQPYLSDL